MKFFVSFKLPLCGYDENMVIDAEDPIDANNIAHEEALGWAQSYFDILDDDYENEELLEEQEWGVDYIFVYDIDYTVEPYKPAIHDMYL